MPANFIDMSYNLSAAINVLTAFPIPAHTTSGTEAGIASIYYELQQKIFPEATLEIDETLLNKPYTQ